MVYLIMGCGAQGSACAFALAQDEETTKVLLVDKDIRHLPSFLLPYIDKTIFVSQADIKVKETIKTLLEEADVLVNALPYYLNQTATQLAIDAQVHYCDLGGNTQIVEKQKQQHDDARKRNISMVPDCGLAPGMVNILCQAAIDQLDDVTAVNAFVGGLPKDPVPPLNYQIVYSMQGVLDYYTTPVLVLENAKLVEKPALSGLEHLHFEGIGTLEAFHTAGGISTMPIEYQDKICAMSYKTLRYPGHADLMASFRDLGLFDQTPILVDNSMVSPRDAFIASVEPKLLAPNAPDLVALRVQVSGQSNGDHKNITYEMIEHMDIQNSISAMMRTTGYSLAAVAKLQAKGHVKAGVYTAAECIDANEFLTQLKGYDIDITREETSKDS